MSETAQTEQAQLPAPIQPRLPSVTISAENKRAGVQVATLQDVEMIARLAAQSKYFKDVGDMAQGCMKILYGLEMGMSATEALNGLYIINGKVNMYADAISERLHRVKGLEVKVIELNPQTCTLALVFEGEEQGRATFTIEQAQKMGLCNKQTWQSDPESQLYARALTRLHKRFGKKYWANAVQSVEEMQDVMEGAPVSYEAEVVEDQQPEEKAKLPEKVATEAPKPKAPKSGARKESSTSGASPTTNTSTSAGPPEPAVSSNANSSEPEPPKQEGAAETVQESSAPAGTATESKEPESASAPATAAEQKTPPTEEPKKRQVDLW